MNSIRTIRRRLGMSQAELGAAIGRTQGNVGHYERGQTVPPEVARKLLAVAAARGVAITFDDVYALHGDEMEGVSAANDCAEEQEAQEEGEAR